MNAEHSGILRQCLRDLAYEIQRMGGFASAHREIDAEDVQSIRGIRQRADTILNDIDKLLEQP